MNQSVNTLTENTTATGGVVQSTIDPIDNEPVPNLFVEAPLPGPLAQGVVFIPYRVENLRILPVAGPAARNVSPRVGHLHITVDDLPWWWADAGDSNTVDIAGLPPGQHEVTIALVDANHNLLLGQAVTVPFTVPSSAPDHHMHEAR